METETNIEISSAISNAARQIWKCHSDNVWISTNFFWKGVVSSFLFFCATTKKKQERQQFERPYLLIREEELKNVEFTRAKDSQRLLKNELTFQCLRHFFLWHFFFFFFQRKRSQRKLFQFLAKFPTKFRNFSFFVFDYAIFCWCCRWPILFVLQSGTISKQIV